MKIKKYLWINKEGIVLGSLWGFISPFAGLGMATLPHITFWNKLLILPALIAKSFGVSGIEGFLLSVIIGGLIGMSIDSLYKPNE